MNESDLLNNKNTEKWGGGKASSLVKNFMVMQLYMQLYSCLQSEQQLSIARYS